MALLHSYTLDSGTGTQTLTDVLDPIDMSGYQSLTLVGRLTKTDIDAADTCAIRLESTWDRNTTGTVWDTRIRLADFTGDMSASASAPEQREGTVQQHIDISSVEETHEATGSAGATAATASTVLNGPFPGPRWLTTGRASSWRIVIDVTDADADCDFEGVVEVHGVAKKP